MLSRSHYDRKGPHKGASTNVCVFLQRGMVPTSCPGAACRSNTSLRRESSHAGEDDHRHTSHDAGHINSEKKSDLWAQMLILYIIVCIFWALTSIKAIRNCIPGIF